MLSNLRRFPLDVRAVSAKKKVTKKILTKQEYFECIKGETNNNLAPELTPREKIKSQVTHKRRILSVQNKMAAFSSNCYEAGPSFFSRMLQNLIAGSLAELNYSEMFQTVFKMLTWKAESFGN